jgi:hypothetical protein
MDSTNIQDGSIVKTLNAKQRDAVKDKFKVFSFDFIFFKATITQAWYRDSMIRLTSL